MDLEQLADYVVDYLNDYFGINGDTAEEETPLIECTAEKPETTAEVEAEHSYWRLFITPHSTTEVKINRAGKTLEHPSVSVAVSGPTEEIERAIGIKYVDQIKRALRTSKFDGYRWNSNNTSTTFNPNSIARGQFLSIFQAEYVGIR